MSTHSAIRQFSSLAQLQRYLKDKEPKPGTSYSLDRMQQAAEQLGHPELRYKVVHVGGTSGKGSTCTMIASILQAGGYKVGLYTSPSLQSALERITVHGKWITERKLLQIANNIQHSLADLKLTHFELFTLAAFQHFADQQVDYAVIEVGVGGKLDATNIVQPTVAIVTDVGMDHMKLLGKTKAAIARDKEMIIKPGCIGLTGTRLIRRGTYINLNQAKIISTTLQGTLFSYKHWKRLQLQMLGTYQVRNAILAIEATSRLGVGSAAIRYGLQQAKQRGRFEIVSRKPLIIIDGAHNSQKMTAFVASLKQLVSVQQQTIVAICAIKKTKEIAPILKQLLPAVDTIILTTFPGSHNLIRLEWMARHQNKQVQIKKISNTEQAYDYLRNHLNPTDVGVITGSLYLIGKLLPKL